MLFVICIIFMCKIIEMHALEFVYHNHTVMTDYLQNFCQKYEHLQCNLKSIGTTRENRELWAIELHVPQENQQIPIPNIKLVGNIHGNEAVGREMLLHLLEYMAENYPSDPKIKRLLENTKVHIMPSMNPDGFEMASEGLCQGEHGRNNGPKGNDLNRNFPDKFRINKEPPQPERIAMQNWLKNITFVLSAGLHGGALVANYPYESSDPRNIRKAHYAAAPDDDVFRHLSLTYSKMHPDMHKGEPCSSGGSKQTKFENGITNGALWYPLTGGMQDYNYVFHGCMEVTLEISCCKYPFARELKGLWTKNRNALIEYALQAQLGVKGIIWDASTKERISHANLTIAGRNMLFRASADGEFWRILLPRDKPYEIQINHTGYHSTILNFTVTKGTPTILNVYLCKYSMCPASEHVTTTTKVSTLSTAVYSTSILATITEKVIKNVTNNQLNSIETEVVTEQEKHSKVVKKVDSEEFSNSISNSIETNLFIICIICFLFTKFSQFLY